MSIPFLKPAPDRAPKVGYLTARTLPAGWSLLDDEAERRLPYSHLLNPHTAACEDGGLVTTFKLRGRPGHTASPAERKRWHDALNVTLMQLARPEFALVLQTVRRKAPPPPRNPMAGLWAQMVDDAWRERVLSGAMLTEHYVSIIRRAPNAFGKLSRATMRAEKSISDEEKATMLEQRARMVRSSLRPYGVEVLGDVLERGVARNQVLEHYAGILNGQWRRIARPESHLASALAWTTITWGRDTLCFEGPSEEHTRYAAMLSLQRYSATPRIGMLDRPLDGDFECIITHTFEYQAQEQAAHHLETRWYHGAEGDDAGTQLALIDEAIDEVRGTEVARGFHQCTIMPLVRSPRALDAAVADIIGDLEPMVFVREQWGVMQTQFWSQFPNNDRKYAGRRSPTVSTDNLAAWCPLPGLHTQTSARHHWGRPGMTLETVPVDLDVEDHIDLIKAGSPIAHGFHENTLGHFLVVGGSDIGKTVRLGILAAYYVGLHGARLRFFDRDRGAELWIRALGGAYYTLALGMCTGWAPFMCEDSERNRGELYALVTLCITGGHPERVSPEQNRCLMDAIDDIFDLPREQRTFTAFRDTTKGSISGPEDPYRLLEPWCGEGPHAWLFDADTDALSLGDDVIGWDVTSLGSAAHVEAVAAHFMQWRIRADSKDAGRTCVWFDEGFEMLKFFGELLRTTAQTGRKDDVTLGFATQSPNHLDSPVGAALIDQSAVRYLPGNPEARPEDYKLLQCTDAEIALIRALPPESRATLIKRKSGMSYVTRDDLGADCPLMPILSRSKDDLALSERVFADVGTEPEAWVPEFLRLKAKENAA